MQTIIASSHLTLRKRFVKEFKPNSSSPVFDHVVSPQNAPEISPAIEKLDEENRKLKHKIEKIEAEREAYKDMVEVLEGRAEKAESEVLCFCKENKSLKIAIDKEIDNGKVLKNLQNDINKNRTDLNTAAKTTKSKDKELYNLENKIINQQDTIKKLKDQIKDLKNYKKKSENEFNVLE